MATTRRIFMGGMAAGLATALSASLASRPALAAGGYPWPLGVQLWSVKAELDRDVDATLRQLAGLGFREVETIGLHGRTPQQFRAVAESCGLKIVGAHSAMGDLSNDAAERIAQAKALGAEWLIASSPHPDRPLQGGDWLTSMREAMTLDAWKKNAAELNRVGGLARAAGLKLAYHNNPIEFALYDGRRGYDVILNDTDPALVKLELDIAWAAAGGADPIAILNTHADRVRMIHIKGLKSRPPLGRYGTDFTTGVVGAGDIIDWPAVIQAARRAGVQHAFLEQEPPYARPVMESLARSRDYLQTL